MATTAHFGLIGLKGGDDISWIQTGEPFVVSSGDGTPKNGGTLVARKGSRRLELFSLRAMTSMLLGYKVPEEFDIWACWSHNGITLRDALNRRRDGR